MRIYIRSPLKNKILHDHIVVGIADSSQPEHLQMIKDLTTEKVKTLVRQREAVHKDQLTDYIMCLCVCACSLSLQAKGFPS